MSLFILKTLSWFPISLSNDKVSSDILSLITSLLISQSQYLSHFFPPSASRLGKQRYGEHLKEILDSLRFILTIAPGVCWTKNRSQDCHLMALWAQAWYLTLQCWESLSVKWNHTSQGCFVHDKGGSLNFRMDGEICVIPVYYLVFTRLIWNVYDDCIYWRFELWKECLTISDIITNLLA